MERVSPVGRPRLRGVGRHRPQYKLNAESVEKKLTILNYLDKNGMTPTINKFYSALSLKSRESKRTAILRWRREREKLEDAAAVGKGSHTKIRSLGVGAILTTEMETDIVAWVNALREDGIPVSTLMLSDKARQVANEGGATGFRASDKWIVGFKRRHHFSMRTPTRQSQINPVDIEAVATAFASLVDSTMRDLGIRRVCNADQTAVFFEYVARKTLHRRGDKTVWVKCSGASKERATVMLLGDSDGGRYDPFVVFKVSPSRNSATQDINTDDRRGFGARVWKDVVRITKETKLQIYGNSKGWWTGHLSVCFLRHHFSDRPSPQEPVLLLWDDFSGHWTEDVQQYAKDINVVLLKVPPHTTPLSQPADVAWNYPFKCHLRDHWHSDMQAQIAAAHCPDKGFRLARPNRQKICTWIDGAWRGISSTTIANGFRASAVQPSDSCVAASDLIDELQRLSLLSGYPVSPEKDFANQPSQFPRV